MEPVAEPMHWQMQPTVNPLNRPYSPKSCALGTEDTAAPIRNVPTVNVARLSLAPSDFADKGPIVVSKVEVVSVNAHARARSKMLKIGVWSLLSNDDLASS